MSFFVRLPLHNSLTARAIATKCYVVTNEDLKYYLAQRWANCDPLHYSVWPTGASKKIKNKHLHLNQD